MQKIYTLAQKLYNRLENDGAFLACYATAEHEHDFIEKLDNSLRWQNIYLQYSINPNQHKLFKNNLLDNAKSYYQAIKRMDKHEVDKYIDTIISKDN